MPHAQDTLDYGHQSCAPGPGRSHCLAMELPEGLGYSGAEVVGWFLAGLHLGDGHQPDLARFLALAWESLPLDAAATAAAALVAIRHRAFPIQTDVRPDVTRIRPHFQSAKVYSQLHKTNT